MDKKLIVLLEGKNDYVLFEILERSVELRNPSIHCIPHYTMDLINQSGEIVNIVWEEIKKLMRDYYRIKNHNELINNVVGIVQFIDVDGAICRDENCLNISEFCRNNFYDTNNNCISFNSKRNLDNFKIKSERRFSNMKKLFDLGNFYSIPYRLIYSNSNFEHAYYNRLNLSSEEKREISRKLKEQFTEAINRKELETFLRKYWPQETNINNYLNSWTYLIDCKDPFKPCSNFVFLHDEISKLLNK